MPMEHHFGKPTKPGPSGEYATIPDERYDEDEDDELSFIFPHDDPELDKIFGLTPSHAIGATEYSQQHSWMSDCLASLTPEHRTCMLEWLYFQIQGIYEVFKSSGVVLCHSQDYRGGPGRSG